MTLSKTYLDRTVSKVLGLLRAMESSLYPIERSHAIKLLVEQEVTEGSLRVTEACEVIERVTLEAGGEI